MKIKAIAVFALLLPCSAAFAASQGQGVVFPLSKASDLLDQCSRSSPDPAEFWSPTPQQIQDLETDFDQATRAILKQREEEFPKGGYDRQYVGIVVDGRRLIYINAFVPEAGIFEIPGGGPAKDFWRTNAVQVCDGGSYYFGAVYDPATKSFSKFSFNVHS